MSFGGQRDSSMFSGLMEHGGVGGIRCRAKIMDECGRYNYVGWE